MSLVTKNVRSGITKEKLLELTSANYPHLKDIFL